MPRTANVPQGARKKPSTAALLAAAAEIVGTEGLQGLALRPLALRLGVSVTVLTTHFGSRNDLVAAICGAASEQEAAWIGGWRAMLDEIGTLPRATGAALAEAILDEQATVLRATTALYFELLHAASSDEPVRSALDGWTTVRRAFWDGLGRLAGIDADLVDSGWWHGYAVAEGFYGHVLHGDPSYRLLRRTCLQRLLAGGAAGDGAAADGVVFGWLGERMHHVANEAGGADAGDAPAWVSLAVRACGIRLAAQGVAAVTHRAIAADAGVAHTTLSYRFPTQHDLVTAGLRMITAHILSSVEAESLEAVQRLRTANDGARLDLARANLAVALAARRMPELSRQLAHMRSRRGLHLARVLRKHAPAAQGIDPLCAQVMSLGLAGLANTEPPGERCDALVAAAFAAVARWACADTQA